MTCKQNRIEYNRNDGWPLFKKTLHVVHNYKTQLFHNHLNDIFPMKLSVSKFLFGVQSSISVVALSFFKKIY